MSEKVTYPIGQQSFQVLREDDSVYVDKSMYIKTVVEERTKYMFLARPRRFGKSLFLSTLKCFFEGKRNLFKGLAVDSMEWDWAEYPVLHLDLNVSKYNETEELEDVLGSYFRTWEKKYGLHDHSDNINVRFKEIIEKAHESTGRKVVVLVDEYDKPLVGNLNDQERFEHYRVRLQSIYSNFKNCADHIQLVFLTGVSRFSKLSIFSGLNNILDISFLDEYADLCGITESELINYFQEGISEIAKRYRIDNESMLCRLKENYDGYRFSENGSDIYNPWSILNALRAKRIGNYWNETGVPTIIAEALKKINVDLKSYLTTTRCTRSQLKGLTLDSIDPLSLLYQGGYLTIKDYDLNSDRYTLGIPNHEVEEGLLDVLLPLYSDLKHHDADAFIWKYVDLLNDGNAEGFMKELSLFFAGIPYDLKMDDENNFQNALYIFTTLLGLKVKAEDHTSDGRIDLVIETSDYIYIIELKYGGTPLEALHQIKCKQYSLKYGGDSRTKIEIGSNFDPKTRRIGEWLIEKRP